MNNPTDGPVHTWFSLSYSNYQVLPRTLMQSMPVEWQERIVRCLEEISDAYTHIEQPESYIVQASVEREVMELDEQQLAEQGYTETWYDEEEPNGLDAIGVDMAEWEAEHELPDGPVYHDPSGQGVPWDHRVQIPVPDPIPHYNRGRTYIEART